MHDFLFKVKKKCTQICAPVFDLSGVGLSERPFSHHFLSAFASLAAAQLSLLVILRAFFPSSLCSFVPLVAINSVDRFPTILLENRY